MPNIRGKEILDHLENMQNIIDFDKEIEDGDFDCG